MRNLFIAAMMLFAGLSAQAQGTPEKGDMQLNAGLGLSGYGIPIYLGLDYGVGHDITIGGRVSYRTYTEHNWRTTTIGFAANGNYHFNQLLSLPSKFDLYAGLSLGYLHYTNKYTGPDNVYRSKVTNDSPLDWGIQIGGRYFFTDQLGLNLEFSGGALYGAHIGITYKF